MKLYHGSNIEINDIDLKRCKPNKDFGQGFYLTDIKEQALQMAMRRTRIVGNGTPSVTTYEFDDTLLNLPLLSVRIFNAPCQEWALFVLQNRNEYQSEASLYDIVIGPIADDGVAFQLEQKKQSLIYKSYEHRTEISHRLHR